MLPKVTILQLLEVTTIVGLALALDRLPYMWRAVGLNFTLYLVVSWGAVCGAYLGIRWSRRRDLRSIAGAAGVAAAALTLINATRTGISIAESLRQATDGAYFEWRSDWPLLLTLILVVTLSATMLAPIAAVLALGLVRAGRRIAKRLDQTDRDLEIQK